VHDALAANLLIRQHVLVVRHTQLLRSATAAGEQILLPILLLRKPNEHGADFEGDQAARCGRGLTIKKRVEAQLLANPAAPAAAE